MIMTDDIHSELSRVSKEFLSYCAAYDLMIAGVQPTIKQQNSTTELMLGIGSALLFIEKKMDEVREKASELYELAYGKKLPDNSAETLSIIIKEHSSIIEPSKSDVDDLFKRFGIDL
jgi:hypothetical protein